MDSVLKEKIEGVVLQDKAAAWAQAVHALYVAGFAQAGQYLETHAPEYVHQAEKEINTPGSVP